MRSLDKLETREGVQRRPTPWQFVLGTVLCGVQFSLKAGQDPFDIAWQQTMGRNHQTAVFGENRDRRNTGEQGVPNSVWLPAPINREEAHHGRRPSLPILIDDATHVVPAAQRAG